MKKLAAILLVIGSVYYFWSSRSHVPPPPEVGPLETPGRFGVCAADRTVQISAPASASGCESNSPLETTTSYSGDDLIVELVGFRNTKVPGDGVKCPDQVTLGVSGDVVLEDSWLQSGGAEKRLVVKALGVENIYALRVSEREVHVRRVKEINGTYNRTFLGSSEPFRCKRIGLTGSRPYFWIEDRPSDDPSIACTGEEDCVRLLDGESCNQCGRKTRDRLLGQLVSCELDHNVNCVCESGRCLNRPKANKYDCSVDTDCKPSFDCLSSEPYEKNEADTLAQRKGQIVALKCSCVQGSCQSKQRSPEF